MSLLGFIAVETAHAGLPARYDLVFDGTAQGWQVDSIFDGGDIDGDGLPELVANGDKLRYFGWNGTAMVLKQELSSSLLGAPAIVEDFDMDGHSEWLFAGTTWQMGAVAYDNRTGVQSYVVDPGRPTTGIFVAPFASHLVVAAGWADPLMRHGGRALVMSAGGDAQIWDLWTTTGPSETLVQVHSELSRVGDINHDGVDDLAWTDSSTGTAFVQLGVAPWTGGQLTTPRCVEGLTAPIVGTPVALGDINGDGFDDYGWLRQAANYGFVVYAVGGASGGTINGNSCFLAGTNVDAGKTSVWQPGYSEVSVSVGLDVDDDGLADMLYLEPGDGRNGNSLLLYAGTSAGSLALSPRVIFHDATPTYESATYELNHVLAMPDLNGDGINDIIVAGASSVYIAFGIHDADGDGVGASADCDDSNDSVNLFAAEVCDNVDNDCDGLVDADDSDVEAASLQSYYRDEDQDGFGDGSNMRVACPGDPDASSWGVGNSDDCDDSDANISPEAPELSCDGIDQDCYSGDYCPSQDTGAHDSNDTSANDSTNDTQNRCGCATFGSPTFVAGWWAMLAVALAWRRPHRRR